MIIEDYVGFETAKLLKEKGFDIFCMFKFIDPEDRNNNKMFPFFTDVFVYDEDGNLSVDRKKNSELKSYEYSAPTHQMAMKWLREVHNLLIVPMLWTKHFVNNEIRHFQYCYEIYHLRKGATPIHADSKTMFYTYEEACEAAIKYCLENLI